jgi:hypothetical protein
VEVWACQNLKNRSPVVQSPALPKVAATRQRSLLQASPVEVKDVTVEQWLRTGEQAGLLEDYFGEQLYHEFRDMSHEASMRPFVVDLAY